jgi:alpha-D-ribose 1-methylphosphonate 5-triphosphate synthase subunit PhnH
VTSSAAMAGGLDDRVRGPQAIFRAVLTALSEPGRLLTLGEPVAPPPPLDVGAAAVLAALADVDTPIFLGPSFTATGPVADWVAFQTGAPMTARPDHALFAVLAAPEDVPLGSFGQGSHDYPDRSTTVLIQLAALSGGSRLLLAGPGIPGERAVTPPLPSEWVEDWNGNRRRFPLGVDVLLVAGGSIMGLPRTTLITRG